MGLLFGDGAIGIVRQGEKFLGSGRVSREINRCAEGFSVFQGLPVFLMNADKVSDTRTSSVGPLYSFTFTRNLEMITMELKVQA